MYNVCKNYGFNFKFVLFVALQYITLATTITNTTKIIIIT